MTTGIKANSTQLASLCIGRGEQCRTTTALQVSGGTTCGVEALSNVVDSNIAIRFLCTDEAELTLRLGSKCSRNGRGKGSDRQSLNLLHGNHDQPQVCLKGVYNA